MTIIPSFRIASLPAAQNLSSDALSFELRRQDPHSSVQEDTDQNSAAANTKTLSVICGGLLC